MRTKKSIRRAFQAAMPDVLHRVMEDCPAGKAEKPAPAPASTPMMPHNHWFKELVATAAALALLIGVAAGGLMFLRNTGGLQASQNPSAPADSEPSLDDPIGEVPLAVPASVRAEILSMLGITEGAELEIVPSLRGEYYAYAVGHEGFAYSFVFDSFDEFVGVDILDSTRESILTPQVAKRLLHQYLWATVDTEPADVMIGPTVVTEGELLTLDVGIFYQFFVSLNPVMSHLPSYYVEATTGDVYEKLPESNVTPPEEPWNILESRDRALLAVHLSLDEVYFLKGEYPANEDGEYYIRWTITSEKGTILVNQMKDYTVLEIMSNEPVEGSPFADIPPEWYPWQKARTIALEDAGVRLEDVTGLDCSYSDQNAWYNILFTIDGLNHIYTISAKNGWIFERNTVDMTKILSAEYAVDLVARQSQLPAALKAAVLSGEAGITCTLTNERVDPVYDVQFLWKDDHTAYVCNARVHATSGKLMHFRVEETPHETGAPIGSTVLTVDNVAEHTIVNLFGFSMDESHVLGFEVSPEHYVVEFLAAGCHYKVFVDAVSGERIDHEAEDQGDTLERFNVAFGDQTSYYNWALVDLYKDITELNLQTLFANAKADGWDIPAVEWYDAWYEGLSETDKHLDHNFVPRELMDQILQVYFGIRLDDLPEESYAGLTYIDLIGWYSVVASDYSAVVQFRAVGLEERENGEIWLYYTCNGSNDLQVVSLRASRNSNVPWQIVFNAEYIPYLMYSTTAESIPN